jgi:hypothetical protein
VDRRAALWLAIFPVATEQRFGLRLPSRHSLRLDRLYSTEDFGDWDDRGKRGGEPTAEPDFDFPLCVPVAIGTSDETQDINICYSNVSRFNAGIRTERCFRWFDRQLWCW